MSVLYKIPNNYRKNDGIMTPLYLKDYEHFFYANLDETITDVDFANWRLSLFDLRGNEIAQNIGTLTQDIITGAQFRFYASFTIPANVVDGIYELVIYNTSTMELKYISNCIKVFSLEDVERYVLLFYRNSSNLYNYNYQGVANYNTVFLELSLIEQQPDIERQQYTEVTTGRRRNQRSVSNKVLSLESYFFDDEANDMMLALSLHDDIMINGKIVDVRTAFEITTNVFNSVQKGVIEFYDEEFSTINLNG